MIQAEAFRELELEGLIPPDRDDFIRSASCWLLELLLSASGFDFRELDELVRRGPLRVLKLREKTEQERVDEKNFETERFFMTLFQLFQPGNPANPVKESHHD